MNVKVITIDFWNTLFTSDSGSLRNSARNKVFIDTINDLGISFNAELLDEVVKKSWEYYNNIWINEVRTPSTFEIINYLWEKIDLPKNAKAIDYLVDFFEKSILYFPPKLQPNARFAIENLSKKFNLAIISDTDRKSVV